MESHIKFTDVSKKFPMYRSRLDQVRELLHPRGRRYHKEFWALRNVSFELERGQSLGIIGRNGSGKSTLLQILCRIMQPTEGSVSVNGRISALLELGAGFNKQFTGRQNVYLNGTLMGFSREQMDNRIDDIAAFADIGEFIDQPVKTYSSGMYIRLAFASAVHVDPDILIVDEALAVGDTFFQHKCHAHMEKMMGGGVTVVMVTHDMRSVRKYCDQAIVLHNGREIFSGDTQNAIRVYYSSLRAVDKPENNISSTVPAAVTLTAHSTQRIQDWPMEAAFIDISELTQVGEGAAICTAIAVTDSDGQPTRIFEHGDTAIFYYEFRANQNLETPVGVVTLMSRDNIIVHSKSSFQFEGDLGIETVPQGASVRFRQEVKLNLYPDRYLVGFGLKMIRHETYGLLEELTASQIFEANIPLCHLDKAVEISISWPSEGFGFPHSGLCDLPGKCDADLLIVDAPQPEIR